MAEGTVKTGIEALDLFLKGGLPSGFTTLLLAPSGAGAETFAKQFACGDPKARVVYLTTDESTREVQVAAKEAGWELGNVEVIDLQTAFAESMLDRQDTPTTGRRFDPRDLMEGTSSRDLLDPKPSSARATSDYMRRLLEPFTRLRGPDRVVVHSLDFYLNMYPLDQLVATLTAQKAANSRQGGLLLWVLSSGAHGSTAERRIELLADCLIELEVTRKGTSFERFFLVKKVKNRSTGVGVSTYEVTPRGFTLETLERIM